MESLQQLKSRLRAVGNIGTITKAMEVVSATKMRKAQEFALSSRPYAFAALSALADLLKFAPPHLLELSPLVAGSSNRATVRTPVTKEKTLLVLVASDRGLAGSFNSQVTRAADKFLTGLPASEAGSLSGEVEFVVVGKKLTSWAMKSAFPVVMTFTDFGDHAEPEDVAPLSTFVSEGFLAGRWTRVVVISTHFKTTLSQFAVTRELLPLHLDIVRDTINELVPEHGKYSEYRSNMTNLTNGSYVEFLFEPSPTAVLESILPHLVNMELFHLVLEANASEHSARMVAMKNASENASELGDSLSLQFNKARQAAITKEMIEITSAQSAIS